MGGVVTDVDAGLGHDLDSQPIDLAGRSGTGRVHVYSRVERLQKAVSHLAAASCFRYIISRCSYDVEVDQSVIDTCEDEYDGYYAAKPSLEPLCLVVEPPYLCHAVCQNPCRQYDRQSCGQGVDRWKQVARAFEGRHGYEHAEIEQSAGGAECEGKQYTQKENSPSHLVGRLSSTAVCIPNFGRGSLSPKSMNRPMSIRAGSQQSLTPTRSALSVCRRCRRRCV